MGCSNLDPQVAEQAGPVDGVIPAEVYQGDVCVSISEGAPFATKSEDAIYYTLKGENGEEIYTLVIEPSMAEDGLVFCNHYSEAGDLIATLVYSENDLLDVEITSEYEITKGEGLKKFTSCVKETYHQLRDNVQHGNEITCDFNVTLCDAVSAVAAVVSCTGSKDESTNNPE